MLYQINTPQSARTFKASSFTAAYVVATLLGGGFCSLWQDGKQVMPVFMFGGAEKWYQRTFGKNFQEVVQEVSPDEIAQIYMTILVGKPEERQRYLQELSMIHHSKGTLLIAAGAWCLQYRPTPYGSCRLPDGGDVVQLLDGRELPIKEMLGEIGTNLWLVASADPILRNHPRCRWWLGRSRNDCSLKGDPWQSQKDSPRELYWS